LERLRQEIDRAATKISDLIAAEESTIATLETRLQEKKGREDFWQDIAALKGMVRTIKHERGAIKEALRRQLHEFEGRIDDLPSSEDEDLVDDLQDDLQDAKDYLDDRFDEIEDRIDSFTDRVEETEERIKERLREGRAYVIPPRPPGHFTMRSNVVVPEIRIPEIRIPDVGHLIEESLSKAWTGVPSAIVSSVRLPQADLSLIDALVDAGVFRSRNEGIAFFAHRGIESSKDWLTKVQEKLDEIRKLQDETKKEIEKVIGESPPKPQGPEAPTSPGSDQQEKTETK